MSNAVHMSKTKASPLPSFISCQMKSQLHLTCKCGHDLDTHAHGIKPCSYDSDLELFLSASVGSNSNLESGSLPVDDPSASSVSGCSAQEQQAASMTAQLWLVNATDWQLSDQHLDQLLDKYCDSARAAKVRRFVNPMPRKVRLVRSSIEISYCPTDRRTC